MGKFCIEVKMSHLRVKGTVKVTLFIYIKEHNFKDQKTYCNTWNVIFHGCEIWTIGKFERKRLGAIEM